MAVITKDFAVLIGSPTITDYKETTAILDLLRRATLDALKEPQRQLKEYLRSLNKAMQSKPKGERHFGDFETNRAFAMLLRDQLNSLELRLKCPACGQPAILVCGKPQRSIKGAFRFDHTVDGKKVIHSTSVDLFKLVTVSPGRDGRRIN